MAEDNQAIAEGEHIQGAMAQASGWHRLTGHRPGT
jgi:hypothetical protein